MSAALGQCKLTRWGVSTFVATSLGCSPAASVSARDLSDANDTGRTLAAKDDTDRALLLELPRLQAGVPRKIGAKTVIAEAPYAAASGRSCRALHSTEHARPATHQLACSDGKRWFFVPDVFGAGSAAE